MFIMNKMAYVFDEDGVYDMADVVKFDQSTNYADEFEPKLDADVEFGNDADQFELDVDGDLESANNTSSRPGAG